MKEARAQAAKEEKRVEERKRQIALLGISPNGQLYVDVQISAALPFP